MTDREKIKATLKFCSDKDDNCIGCPVFDPDDISDCTGNVMNVAANIIDKLETENAALKDQLETARKERDEYKTKLVAAVTKGVELHAENQVLKTVAKSYGIEVSMVEKECGEQEGER